MHIIRSKFYKKEDMIFISHLDLVRLLERAMRRANIPIAYSQGFNPHPIMAFATALGIGISSEGEYMDIQLAEKIEPKEFMDKLNAVLPQGLGILQCQYIDSSEKSLMSVVDASIYVVKVPLTEEIGQRILVDKINGFLSLEEIVDMKEKKKKKHGSRSRNNEVQSVNIRKLIHKIELLILENKEVILKMSLAAGSSGNLKPEVVLKKLQENTGLPIVFDGVRIHRLELLKSHDGQLMPLLRGLKSL